MTSKVASAIRKIAGKLQNNAVQQPTMPEVKGSKLFKHLAENYYQPGKPASFGSLPFPVQQEFAKAEDNLNNNVATKDTLNPPSTAEGAATASV